MKQYREELQHIAQALYSEDTDYGTLFNACRSYQILMMEVSGLQAEAEGYKENIYTDLGRAVAPHWASECVRDIIRTRRFAKGVFEAISDLKKSTRKRIHVLYAGTGPFAALVVPLITQFSSEEIGFSLLEIHPTSFKAVQLLFKKLGATDYIISLEQADATNYDIPDSDDVDILLIETMTHGLKSEHQVAISLQLLPQLRPDALLIPESIQLHVVAVNSEKRMAHRMSTTGPIGYHQQLNTVFQLDRERIAQFSDEFQKNKQGFEFPMVITPLNKKELRGYDELHVETDITVYGAHCLGIDDSGLSVLLKISDLSQLTSTQTRLETTYICDADPGLFTAFTL